VAKIEAALKNLDGVEDAKVFFNTGKIEVQHNPEKVKAPELVKAVKAVGYEAREAAY
jgi:copper chaperone CopZ